MESSIASPPRVIRLLGRAAIEEPDGAGVARAVHRARIALLAVLATSRNRSASRDRLVSLLWPEATSDSGRHQLREAVYRLRDLLGEGVLESVGNELRLEPARVRCDVWDFEAAARRSDWEEADRLYTGALLEEFNPNGSAELEHWLDAERARLSAVHAHALEALAAAHEGRGDRDGAVALWRRRAESDPYDARLAFRLMQALEAAGDRVGALRHAARHAELLRSELGAVPDPRVAAFAEHLRQEPATREFFPTPLVLTPDPALPVTAPATGPKPRTRLRRRPAGLAVIVTLAFLTTGFFGGRAAGIFPARTLVSTGALAPKPRLMLTDFTVTGADSALSQPFADVTRMSLAQSPAITLAGPAMIRAALERSRRPPDTRVDLELAREIAPREGVTAIVDGRIIRDTSRSGAGFLVTLRLVSADSGDVLASASRTAQELDDLIPAIDVLARKLRARIGESLRDIRATRPLYRLTTRSITALRLTSQATQFNNQTRYLEAVPLLRQAIALDPEFTEAWRMLAVVMLNARIFPVSATDSALEMAYRYRDRITERERNHIEAFYLANGPHGDRGRAIEAWERIVAAGDSSGPVVNLVSFYNQRRQWEKVETLVASRLRDRRWIGPNMLHGILTALTALGKPAEAETLLAWIGIPRLADNPRVRMERATLSYRRGRVMEFTRTIEAARSADDPDLRFRANEAASQLARLEGRVELAREHGSAAREIEIARGFVRPPLEDSIQAVVTDLLSPTTSHGAGARLDAAVSAHPLSGMAPVDRPYVQLAWAYAAAGRPREARAVLAALAAVGDSALIRRRQPGIHRALGQIALAESRPRDAVTEFRLAHRLPDGPVGNPLEELALVGRAFDESGAPDSAIAIFESYLETPVWSRLEMDAVYRAEVLQRLGALHEAKGNTLLAARYYREFIELWKNADAGLRPLVTDAALRLRRLSSSG